MFGRHCSRKHKVAEGANASTQLLMLLSQCHMCASYMQSRKGHIAVNCCFVYMRVRAEGEYVIMSACDIFGLL